MKEKLFKEIVWNYYKKNKRHMPWRDDISPYSIFISELMLQQTQVGRVLIKYPLFKAQFPTFKKLARANTTTLFTAWQGMGYNRRALYLKEAAQTVCGKYNGILPDDVVLLDELPGIGYATACSIIAFAFNKPVVFIETNIRRVFIHHFFSDKEHILDKEILPLIEKTCDNKNPREWYWALMDYGTYLAKIVENPNKRSNYYTKQKKFEGSVRQVRGEVLKYLLKRSYSKEEFKKIYKNDERLFTALNGMIKDRIIKEENNSYTI